MYVGVSAKEALEAYAEGKRVVCFEREDDVNGIIDAFTLASLLNEYAFLIDKLDTDAPAEEEPADELSRPPPLRESEGLKGLSGTNHPGNQKLILEKY